ncbi:MAG: FtsQ-type POTRA domain-containing protein [Patescibacteria group bacterium]
MPARRKKKDYYEHAYKNPHRADPKRGIDTRLIFLLCGVSILVSICYWLFFSGAFRVTIIDILNAQSIDPHNIEALVRLELGKKKLFTIPYGASLFFIDSQRIEQAILNEFPVKKVEVKPSLPHRLIIDLEERIPRYIVKTAQGGEPLAIDDEGIALGPAVLGEQWPSWVITAPALLSTTTGAAALPRSALSFLNALEASSAHIRQGYRIQEVDLTRIPLHDISVKTSEQWVILISDAFDTDLQLLNVDRALVEMKDERKVIQYIDVRIPTKIFYK